MTDPRKWRLMVNGRLPASLNMAMDEALFRLCSNETGGLFPVIRFYLWENPTLSFGSSQQFEKAVDREYCKKAGYDIIRRPTGGRAVLHDKEITYCVVARIGKELGDSIQETYRLISEGIVEGLLELGIKVNTYGNEGAEKTDKLTYLPCFASSTRYEIAFNGKKIVGSAQRRNNAAFLQHGSIMLDFESAELLKAIGADPTNTENPANYMTSINEILGRRTDFNEVLPYLVKGFEKRFKVKIDRQDLTDKETAATSFFNEIKYSRDEWNLCK
jgi:lipoate-protein ligase A